MESCDKKNLLFPPFPFRRRREGERLTDPSYIKEFESGSLKRKAENVMDQYRPGGQAREHPGINLRVYAEEYEQARQGAVEAGLSRLDQRKIRRAMG